MTLPFQQPSEEEVNRLRLIWLGRYIRTQTAADVKIRTVLADAAQDAAKEVLALTSKTSFSSAVRISQIKLVMSQVKEVEKDIFGQVSGIIKNGQKNAAVDSVDAFSETDEDYLRAVFQTTQRVEGFVEGQRRQAQIQVANLVSKLYRSDKPLSARVYRSRSLANGWVQRNVTSSIARGDSARQIAKSVSDHIRPDVPGGTSYAALRLGRTEINNAFHATTIELSKDRPWVEKNRWNLSKTHVLQYCLCERYARIGIFDVQATPGKPHPQCRCYITPEVESFEAFATHLSAGYYRGWTSKFAA